MNCRTDAPDGDITESGDLRLLARWAAQQLSEWDDYQRRPERGDYGVECACCMGEMFDGPDREKIARLLELTEPPK